MKCITFIGYILATIIINIILNLSISDDNPQKNTVHGLASTILLLWWLSGYLLDCDGYYGPRITL